MKNLLTKMLGRQMMVTKLSVLALGGLMMVASSCTPEDDPISGGNNTTGGVDSLGANARSSSSVALHWVRKSGDVSTDSVVVTNSTGAVVTSAMVAVPGSNALISGLSLGTEYTFTVYANGGSSVIKYAPAVRTSNLRLWETGDETQGHLSGLVLGTSAGTAATQISVGASNPNRIAADLVLATDNTQSAVPYLSLLAPSITSLSGVPSGRATQFSSGYQVSGGGDNLYFTSGDYVKSTVIATGNAYDIPGSTVGSSSVVLLTKTADGNYARVEILPQANGLLYGEDNTANHNRFIDVNVSYQPVAAWGYVGRPTMPIIRSGDAKRAITIQKYN